MATLSVIIPNHNHARYLRNSLNAILQQSLQPLEVLIVDDGSTDDSVSIIRDFQRCNPLVRLLLNEINLGVNPSINRAITEAEGDFLYFGSADDQVLPGFFEKSMTLLSMYPNAKLCVADLLQFDAVSGTTRTLQPGFSQQACFISACEVANRMAKRRFYPYGGTAIMERNAVTQLGGFIPELRWYGDFFCVFALAYRYGTCYVAEPLAAMRTRATSYSAMGIKKWKVQRETLDLFIRLLKSDPFRDVLIPIRRSGGLCVLGSQIVRTLMTRRSHWDLISWRLLGKVLLNIPITILGLNPATRSPFAWLDRLVRQGLGLSGSIKRYGIQLDDR